MSTSDGFRASFRHTEIFYFSFLDQIFHSSSDIFDGHIQINTVLIEQIYNVYSELLKRSFGNLPDTFRPAVKIRAIKTELGSYNNFPMEWFQGFTNKFFVITIPFRSVKKSDAQFDS